MAVHVTVPIYPTLTENKVQYILEHSESKLCFVEKLGRVPWAEMKDAIPVDLLFVTFFLCPEDAPANVVTWGSIFKYKEAPRESRVRTEDNGVYYLNE